MAQDPRARVTENPFLVLGLAPTCTRVEVERQGTKLLGLLELGIGSAKTYETPFGPQPRDADKVRLAMAELRDPAKRTGHELWARAKPVTSAAAPVTKKRPVLADALRLFGWRR